MRLVLRCLGAAALVLALGCGKTEPSPTFDTKTRPLAGEAPRPVNPGKGRSDPVYNGPAVPLPKSR
ncbi:MAG: hypothetical protein K2V38_18410 [Gemmataceae bacterium]|nr:hypothetical protein [Gemmataceae bacterium]